MEGARPGLDASASGLVRRVIEQHGPDATAWHLFHAIIDAWDPSIEPLRPMFFYGRDEALARLDDPLLSDRYREQKAVLDGIPLRTVVDGAIDEAAYMGHAEVTQGHLLILDIALASGTSVTAMREWRHLLADHVERSRRGPGAHEGWVEYAQPDRYTIIASGEERAAAAEEMRRLAEERGIDVDAWEGIESEGDLRHVVGIGVVRVADDIELQLTALEVRTTVSMLTWRLRSSDEDALHDEPRFSATDDLGTTYRVESGSRSGSGDSADGEMYITPPIPADARTLSVRLEGFRLDPFERRFPGARARTLEVPIEIVVALPG